MTTRRGFLASIGYGACGWAVAGLPIHPSRAQEPDRARSPIRKSLKWGMVRRQDESLGEIFQMLRDVGFDGLELDSPGIPPQDEVLAASRATGLVIDGTVNSKHWEIRLTDARGAVRDQARGFLEQALRETRACGGHSVLLVPGHGQDGPADVIEQRALEEIRKVLPLAAQLGVWILIENVWNEMFYDAAGESNQSADRLARFVDRCDSPWVGVQFDVGNHQKFGRPAEWIRTLGKRIVKLDIKDWGRNSGFGKIGDGEVDWPAVRAALAEIRFTGWAAAEVEGGGRDELADVAQRMDAVLNLD